MQTDLVFAVGVQLVRLLSDTEAIRSSVSIFAPVCVCVMFFWVKRDPENLVTFSVCH